MGAGPSVPVIGGSTMGYQVLRVYPNSPGFDANLQAYFDFIIAAGNTRFNKSDGSLREILKASINQRLKLSVYNTRSKSVREVDIVPSANWGGNGLLGVSIKHSSYEGVDERVWHVIDVSPNSPAAQAGLKPNEDYVIGADSILLKSEDLYQLIEEHEGKPLKLFVYNVTTDNCREVVCTPNSRWGGSGSLGCEFGHGYLHRLCTIPQHQQQQQDLQQSNNHQTQSYQQLQQQYQPSLQQQYQLPPQKQNQVPQQQLYQVPPQPQIQPHSQEQNQAPPQLQNQMPSDQRYQPPSHQQDQVPSPPQYQPPLQQQNQAPLHQPYQLPLQQQYQLPPQPQIQPTLQQQNQAAPQQQNQPPLQQQYQLPPQQQYQLPPQVQGPPQQQYQVITQQQNQVSPQQQYQQPQDAPQQQNQVYRPTRFADL